MNAPDERRPVFRQACADDLPALFALAKAADENGRLTQADLRRGLKVHAAGQWVLQADGQVVAALHSVRLSDIASLEGVALRDVVQRHDPEGAIALVLAWAVAEDAPADATRLLLGSALATLGASPGVTRIVAVASCEEGELPEDGAGDDAARWSAAGARLAVLRDLGASLGHRMPGYRGKTAAHQGCGLRVDFPLPGAAPEVATPQGAQLFVLSAATTERLRAYAQKVLGWLGKRGEGEWFHDAIHTWQVARTPMKQRLALEVRDSAELQMRLQAWIAGTPVYPGTWSSDAPPAPQTPATPSPLATMAMAWVAGEDVSWRDLRSADAPAPRRIAVPTYPFAATRHWFAADTEAPTPVAAPEPPTPQTVLRLVPAWEAQPMEAGSQSDDDKPARHLVLVSGFSQLALSAAENAMPQAEWQRLPTPVADDGRAYVEMVQTTLHAIRSECEARRDGWVLIQVLVEDDVEAWVAGGLSGLLRTAAEEYGDCVGQVIFSDAGTPQEIVRQLGYEARHGHVAIVRYRAGSRQRRTWRTIDEAPSDAPPLRRGGVYCITGGLGGIGMHIAGELLHRGRGAKIVLLGRSPLSGDALTRFEYLQALAAAHPGASIHYRMVDISDSRAVWGMVADIVRLHGHLNGIIHAAGVLNDGYIASKTADTIHNVLAPKVFGAINLDEATRGHDLDFFVLFSSATGVMGNAGQSDYTAANGFLDWFAATRNRRVADGNGHGRTISIDWPLWLDGGMRFPQDRLEAMMRTTGLIPMRTDAGLDVFFGSLSSDHEQWLPLQGDATRIRAWLAESLHPVRRRVKTPAVAEAAMQDGTAVADRLRDAVLQHLVALFAGATERTTDVIDPQDPMENYGLDSIIVNKLNVALTDIFPSLAKTVFFEYRTLAALSEHLLARHIDACRAWVLPEDAVAAPAPQHAVPSAAPPAVVTSSPAAAPVAASAAASREPIAIVGVSGRYPGADDLDAFWRNLRDGRDCIGEIPADRWSLDGFFEPDVDLAIERGQSYSRWGGFLDGFADFDPLFFNISPREAMNVDPQERLFLQECWRTLESAGYTRDDLKSRFGGRIGVFAGITKAGYQLYTLHPTLDGEPFLPYTSFCSTANRVSYFLDIAGPSMPVDTMCSSSLTAIHEACEHILRGECAMAFAGGVNLYLHPHTYAWLSSQHMLSRDGRCRSFGAGGEGFVPGEGVGAVLLKRLSDAERDGDPIHGVILATQVNHGGRTHGYTVPNPNAQSAVIRAAIAAAGIAPEAIGYIETHGTGTELGDPIEVTGLQHAFDLDASGGHRCRIGAVKSNIGHLESASGIAGLTKVLLQMRHGQLAPSLHAGTLNPNIDWAHSIFEVNTHLEAWRPTAPGKTRIAGISSFGASGANAHVIVQEYVRRTAATPSATCAEPLLVPLSARTPEQLAQRARDLIAFVREAEVAPDLAALAYTLQTGREAMEERFCARVRSLDELVGALQACVDGAAAGEHFQTGQVAANRDAMRVFARDEDFRETLQRWMARRKLDRLAELWTRGLDIDWRGLHAGATPARLALPTYPFARERLWIDTRVQPAVETATAGRALHPLVHANVSDLHRQAYASVLVGSESCLRDHVVGGDRILPAVAYLEMVRKAMTLALPGTDDDRVLELRNTVWAQPLIVAGPHPVEIALQPDAETGRIAFTIASTGTDGAMTDTALHCQGDAAFVDATSVDSDAPAAIDLQRLASRMDRGQVDVAAVYRRFAEAGVAFGPAHRGLHRIALGGDEALADLVLPDVVSPADPAYGLHPSLMDSALQVCSCLGGNALDEATAPLLPFALDRVRVLAPCRTDMRAWVRRVASGSDHADAPQLFDIDLIDADGRVCVQMHGFSARARADAVHRETGPRTHALVPVWNRVVPGRAASPAPQRVLVAGNEAAVAWARSSLPGAEALPPTVLADADALATRLRDGCDHVLWVASDTLDAEQGTETDTAVALAGLHEAFRLVKAALPLARPPRWTFVTRRTQAVFAHDRVAPCHGAIAGFVGSLGREYPEWNLRLLDVETLDALDAADCVGLAGDAPVRCLAHRDGAWFERGLAALDARPSAHAGYRQGGTYVVIGGAGGIGEAWSREMIERFDARLVWIGRRPLDAEIAAKIDALGRLGHAPDYHSADATDPDALQRAAERIRAKHPAIHGVVHSAIDLRDQGLAQMDEAELERAVAAKMAVAVNLDTVFGENDLDFALFFSSMISFTTGAGQANYAAGSTFADSFALALAQRRPYPVKIMNWGYWGGVGVVADEFHQARMRQMGIGSLEAPEAMAALRTLVDAPALSQMAVIKALEPQALEAFVLPEHVGGRSRQTSSRLPEAIDAARVALALSPEAVLRDDLPGDEVDALSTELLVATLAGLGIAAADLPEQALARIDPIHARWLDTSLRVAKMFDRIPRDTDTLWREWEAKRPAWLANPRREAQLRLLETCLRALPGILSGTRAATDVIFPDASMTLVQGVYRGNALADGCNNAVGESLIAWLQRQPSSDRMRILEIGAGTGGTTRNLLPRLAAFGDRVAEYCYTDLSKAFLIHAETQFRAQCPALNPKIFDVSRPPAEQGIEAGRYDVVVATNVLHATSDIRRTLRHAKAVLRPGGIVLINEMTGWSLARHLTFGLLEGWWLYEDAGLREPGSPGLAVETWQRLLVDEGFDDVALVVPEAHRLGQCVLAAASDGLWRQRMTKPASARSAPIEAAPVAAPTATVASVPATASLQAAGSLRDRCTAYLRKAVADALKLDEARVGLNRPLADYGLDSILVIGLTGQLRKAFPAIGSTLFFEARDLSDLADTLLRSYPEQAERLFGAQAGTTQATTDTTAPTPTRNLRLSTATTSTTPSTPVAAAASASTIFDVAIVGLSGRYPMANDMETFWQNLSEGRHCVSEVPADRWNWRDHDGDGPDAIYTRWGGFLDHIDRFDPLFFRISPKDAKAMDPQERLFLQACYHAIEDAGYRPDTLARPDKVGVFVGVMNARYTAQPLHYSIANRVSFALDFQGPSVAVDTACSSSLSAIHFALDSLYSGQSDCVIAGGVNLIVDVGHYRELTSVGMLSHGDRCRAFGAGADGFIDAEGVGAVVLKPLAQAERDGDLIHGVIKASAINAGGRTHGYTVPNPVAQGAVVSEALRRAGLSATDVSCIEAHGTGTALGDPIEIAGLRRAFEADSPARGFCAIGSLKSNFGHCESAAGIAALTKVLLQLRHGQLVPSLNADEVNPEIDFAQTPFRLQRTLQPWMRPVKTVDGRTVEVPRTAGISSFGAGGANAHLIVQEYLPSALRPQPMRTERAGPVVVPLSARTSDQLAQKADDLLAFLERARERGEPLSLASLAYSLQTGREERDERLAIVADSVESLIAALRSGDGPDRVRGRAQREAAPVDDAGSRSAAELARAWVSGALIDWAGTHTAAHRPERMRLPLYPFSQESFWQPVLRSLPESASSPVATPATTRHPLLQRSAASLTGMIHEATFTGDDRLGAGLRLRAGAFQGHAVPAAVHLEMVRSAVADLREGEGRAIELTDATWSAPTVFEDVQSLRVSLFARGGSGAGMAIGFEIGDAAPGAQDGVLCQGIAKPVDAAAPVLDLAGLTARMPQGRWDREAFYRDRSAAGLDYGPAYRCLADVRLADAQALAELRLPEDLVDSADGHGMHPVLLDGAMQAGSLLLLPTAVPPSLPWRLASLRWYRPCPARTFAWIRRASVDGVPGLDVDLCDADGRICVELRGLNHGTLDVAEPPPVVKQAPIASSPEVSKPATVEIQSPDAVLAVPHPVDAKPAVTLIAVTLSEPTLEPVSPPVQAPRVSLAPTTAASPEVAPPGAAGEGRVTLAPLDEPAIASGTMAKPSAIALSLET